MFNDNVGEMPLEIFGDYVADCLGIEYEWVYMVCILNGDAPYTAMGHGRGYGWDGLTAIGDGQYFTYCLGHQGYGVGFCADYQSLNFLYYQQSLAQEGSRGDSNVFGGNGVSRFYS